MYTYSFEKLEVWQLAKKLVIKIYKITSQFPAEEKYGLVSQLRRASVSICSNLAEGSGRNTPKDQGSFYNNAYSSLVEVLNQLLISYDLTWISQTDLNEVRNDIELISSKINSLRKATLKKANG
jgi:four helix bundle protein